MYDFKEDLLTEGEIWDEVISDFFPNADPDEIEDELESWIKDQEVYHERCRRN